MDNRIITTDVMEEDFSLEGNLRPQTLDEYIGQEKTKNTLKIYIEAAKQRHDSLDHVLFYGPPGLGKTTLSGIIANEMGVHMKVTSGPAIEKPGEMAAILNNLQEGDILFVDEIHRLNRQVEEVLYPAMEDFAIDIMIGKGASARSIRLDLPKFTLVGATTRAGLLSAPLRDRFGVIHHLEFYSKKELTTIIMRSAQVLGVEIDVKGAGEIAMRSRGTPRLANRLLKRVRFHRGNPKTGKGFLAARHFIDKSENQFSLAPRVAGVHDFRNVGAVHEVFQDFELFSLVGGYGVLPFLRQNG